MLQHISKLKFSTTSLLCPALGLLVLAGCSKKPQMNPMAMMMMQAAPVRVVPAKVTNVPLDISSVGNVEAITTVDVKSRVAGQVLKVLFTEGQNVTKDQLLFQIDPEPLEKQIAQLKADLVKDQALEQQARANVNKDEAQLKQTQAAAERGVQLSKDGIFSKQQTEEVVATNDTALAALAADRAMVESAVATLNSDKAKLAQTELQLTYTKIMAPISGRAGAIAIKAGNLVKDNDAALVTILQIAPVYVSFGVPENLLPEIRKYNSTQPLKVRATVGGETAADGVLRFIDNTVDMSTGTIKLKAEFGNKSHVLWPGQFVSVATQITIERDRILVPSRTVQTGPQGKYVWVLNSDGQTVAMRPVQVLRNIQDAKSVEQAVISTGLHSGDMVVSEGQMRLAPGVKVRLLKEETQVGGAGEGSAATKS